MEFLITESQLQVILKEQQDRDSFSNAMKIMYSFTNNMVNRVLKSYDLNLRMLLTWGTSVAGLMMPLNEFIKKGNFNISENEAYLVLAGVTFLTFFEGKRGMVKVLTKIKEEGLSEVFDVVLEKATQLKESFSNFLRSVKAITSQLLEIVSYSFLIPIVGDIQDLAANSSNVKETATFIAERLIASGLVLLSKEILVSVLRKIIRRLQ